MTISVMKVMVNEKFGSPDVIKLKEMEKPIIGRDEILIKNYATSVNTIDIVFRSGLKVIFGLARLVSGIRSPKRPVLGFDFAGVIEELGSNVTGFEVGDKIFGGPTSGANADFIVAKKENIAKMPSNMNFQQASGVPMAALSALQGLRDSGNITKGQNILIYGASGGIGTFAIQLAKSYGCTVTAVSSGRNKDLVVSLGADAFIDYTQEDFTKDQERYDIVFDAVGKSPLGRWKNALKDDGIFVNSGNPNMSISRFIFSLLGNKFRKKKYRSFDTQYLSEDLGMLAKLIEEEKIETVIDKTFSLEDMAEAHKYYEKGRSTGKVVVRINHD